MFEWLPTVANELHAEIAKIYWVLLIPFTVLSIVIELFKAPEQNPSVHSILKRVVVSMIMLLSFKMCIETITMITEGISTRIQGIESLDDLLKNMLDRYEKNDDLMFNLRDALIYGLHLISYIVALAGIFVANVLMKFVWSCLYISGPLLILMWVHDKTSFVTKNLYGSLLRVSSWKIAWSILSVMLFKFASIEAQMSWDNQITSILVNLCIGLSMLFIPLATKSLLSDGMTGMAGMFAAAPLMATYKSTYGLAGKKAKQVTRSGMTRVNKSVRENATRVQQRATQFRNERKMSNLRSKSYKPNNRRNFEKK